MRNVNSCWAELDDTGRAIRIFRNRNKRFGSENVAYMSLAEAVKEIRQRVFDRCHGSCEWCAASITWATGHMHEVVFRSQGGEVSLENSVFICRECHDKAHGKG